MKINLLLISATALISWSLQLQITITYGLQVVNEHDPHHHQCHRFDQFELSCLAQDPDLCHQITWRSNLLDQLPITIYKLQMMNYRKLQIQTKNITVNCKHESPNPQNPFTIPSGHYKLHLNGIGANTSG